MTNQILASLYSALLIEIVERCVEEGEDHE